MKSHGDLFELIESLTLSEKRYFKMFASMQVKGEQNNYLILFEEIEKLIVEGTFDDDLLLARLGDAPFVRYLPRVKNYLYKSILKSLRSFHEQASLDHQLKDFLKEVRILFRKGLYRQAWKLVSRTRKLAEANERYFVMLEILHWERKLIETHIEDDSFEQRLLENIEAEDRVQGILHNLSELRKISMRIFILNKKIREARSTEHLKAWAKLMDHPVFERFDTFQSFAEQRFWFMLRSNWYANRKDFRKAYDYRKQLISLFKDHDWFIKEEPYTFLFMLNNLINTCTDLRRFEEAEALIDEMRLVPDRYGIPLTDGLNLYIFSTTYIHELNLYLYNCRFEKANDVLPAVISGLERFAGKMNKEKEMELLSKIMYLTYARGDREQCQKWVRVLIEEKENNLRKDLRAAARIMQLILLYEDRRFEELEYAVRNSERYLKSRNWYFEIERAFVSTLKKLIRSEGEGDRGLLADLYHEIERLATDPVEKRAFVYFDYLVWVRSQLNRTSFSREAKLMLN